MKILLVEDDGATVDSIKIGLEISRPEAAVTAVDKGSEALSRLKEESYDVVFLDLGLPDIDGLEVLRQIRCFSGVYIIIISARTNQTVIEQARNLGANDFILKPFAYRLLLDRLEAAEIAS